MDIIVSFFVCFVLFIASVFKGIFVGYALTLGLIIFILLAVRRGYSLWEVLKMAYKGGKKSFVVLQIFVLIGAIISVWMASGTVPAIVYYGLRFLNPHLFIFSAFAISAIVSLLIGTSFGTIGTAGIALMVMARSGGASIPMTAGAIVAGAYFGDRCSPMSSSANLVAVLTDTELYTNIKNMIKTSIIPLILSLILYGIMSFRYPLGKQSTLMSVELMKHFHISIVTLIPAILIFLLSAFRVKVKKSMFISIIAAAVIAVLIEKNTILDTLRYVVMGYSMEGKGYLKDIIKGGGIISMVKVSFLVFISSSFTGIFENTGMLNSVQKLTLKARSRAEVFFVAIIVSIAAAAFGCTQVMAVMLTHMLVKDVYREHEISKDEFAVDIENTAIVIAPLIPWNIAVLVPLTSLMAGFDSILYSYYLFLLPLCNLLFLIARRSSERNLIYGTK